MLASNYRDLGSVVMPSWNGRQKYMHTFDTERLAMAAGFEDYGPAVAALCAAAGHRGVGHMTVDEKIIQPGMSQRRPGAHVDGKFLPAENRWGHPGPAWLHFCNHVPVDRMAVIIAASVPGCIAYRGNFSGAPKNDGDLEHIRRQLGTGELLPSDRGFLLSPDCVHESLRFTQPTKRTFLRIALEQKP